MKKILLINSKFRRLSVTVIVILLSQAVVQNCWGQTNNYFGTTGTITGSVWSTNVAGPYTSTFNTTGGGIMNFGNTVTTITGGSLTVSAINATANVTGWSASGTLSNLSNGVITVNVSGSNLLDMGTQSLTASVTAGYIKTGTGAWGMAGNTYGGGFTLNSGTIVLRGNNALGSGAVNLNSGIVAASGNRAITNPTSISIGGNIQFGEIPANVSTASNTATISFSDNVDLGGATRTFTLGNAAAHTFSGIISNGGLTVDVNPNGTSGSLILSGTNTFSGGITLTNGTLNINNASALGATVGTFTINGGTIGCTAGADVFSSTNNPITIGGNFTFSSSTRNLGMGSGAISLGTSTIRTITNSGTTYISFPGAISGTGSTLNVTNNNTGAVLFSGNNTFTGGMTLDGSSTGRAQFSQANAFPTSGTITINNSGGFRLTATASPSYGLAGQSIICNPTQTTNGSIIQQNSDNSTATLLSNCTLNTDTRVDVNTTSAASMIIAGDISGSGKLIKGGAGTLSLTGTNTFNGGISVLVGFLRISGGSIAASTNVDVASGCSFRIAAGSHTINNLDLSGGGGLTIDAGCTLTITGTFTPGTGTINNLGTIVLKGAAAQTFPGSSAVINNGTLNNLTNLTIDNSNGVSLNKSFIITGTLTLTDGTFSLGTNTLTLNGTITGSGLLRGSSSANLTIGGTGALGTLNFDQTTDGTTNVLNDVIVNRSSGTLSLGNKLVVTNTYTPTAGTLTTGGFLHIRSTASNTGLIAQGSSGGGYIIGDVTVERYMSASTNRAWRLITPGVTTTTTINSNWQEGKVNTVVNTNVAADAAGYGTHITGAGGSSNGFDVTQNNAASLYDWNQGTQDWAVMTNTNVNTLDAQKGYLLFVRGNRDNINTINTTTGSSNTTLRATGTLAQGTQTFTGLASDVPGGDAEVSLVTNPFAAPISWASFYTGTNATNFENFITIWDPNVNTRGGFITITNGGSTSGGTTNLTTNIQSGQAFFVTTKSGINNPTLTILESDKSTINNLNVFRTGPQTEQLNIQLKYVNAGIERSADGVLALFNNSYSNTVDGNDAEQIANWDEDVALLRNGKSLSIESRDLVEEKDTLYLQIANVNKVSATYRWEISPSNFNAPNLQAYLQDNFTNTTTPVSLTSNTVINFTVTSNAASTAANRFSIVFKNNAALPVTISQLKAYQKGNGISVDWTTVQEQNITSYEVEKSKDGQQFTKLATTQAKGNNSNPTNNYTTVDATPQTGNNYYRIKIVEKDGSHSYTQVVRVTIDKMGNSQLTVYPNPIKNNSMNVQLQNMEKGKYNLQLINQLGQVVQEERIEHTGGSVTQTIQLNKNISNGMYQLKLTDERGKTQLQKVVKE